jgi:Secretion system C-terminal sorting domain
MKKNPIPCAWLFLPAGLLFFNLVSTAQTTITSADITLARQGGGTAMSVTWHPVFQKYYSTSGGAFGAPLNTFTSTGTFICQTTHNADNRGSWYNPSNQRIEGNDATGKYGYYPLSVTGNPGPDAVTYFTGSATPDTEKGGVLNSTTSEVLIYNGAAMVYRYSLAGTCLGTTPITIPAGANFNTSHMIYTAVPGSEMGFYDYTNRRVYLYNITGGNYSKYYILPGTAPVPVNYGFAFANGRFFLESGNTWYGYPMYNTAAGFVEWINGGAALTEVTLTRNGATHWDGFDNAMLASVTGTSLSVTKQYYFSKTYGMAVQHIAITNNGASTTTFNLQSNGNLGSDASTKFHYTSVTGVRYTISSDNTSVAANAGDPVVSILYGDAALDNYISAMPYANGSDVTSFTMTNVSIAPGKTKRLLFLVGIGDIDDPDYNRPDQAYLAVQSLSSITNWPADFTSFLTSEQRAEVINWSELSPLPVGFLGFKATKEKTNVLLEWTTVGEENTRDFVVEHSNNGKDWNAIGTVAAAGNSTSLLYYNFMHPDPVSGNNYYRLLQRDLDHLSKYSKIVLVKYAVPGKQLLLYPNPAVNGTVNIHLQQAALVMICNSAGILVLQKQLPAGTQQLDISRLASGIYQVRVATETVPLMIR